MEIEKHQGLEKVVGDSSGDMQLLIPSENVSRENILSQIEILEKEGEYFEAASLAREHGYSDKALENYKRAAEKYKGFVLSKESLLGEDILCPKKHVVKIGDYTIKIKCKTLTCGGLHPFGSIKIKGPDFKISYNSFLFFGRYYELYLNDKKAVMTKVKNEIIKKYGKVVNTEFLEEMLSEALKPYQTT